MIQIRVDDQGNLLISDEQVTAIIPPSQALKEGLWFFINQEIRTIQITGDNGVTVTLSNLPPESITALRNYLAEWLT